MPKFSWASETQLATIDPRLEKVLREAIKYVDFRVLEGHRDKASQDKAYREGKSQVKYPFGKHNSLPSKAVDFAPWPIDWNDTERFVLMAGFIMGIAASMGVKLRYGGDWDSDWKLKEERFRDYGHLELAE